MTEMQIPAFLLRNPTSPGDSLMSTPASAAPPAAPKPTRTRRQNAYVAILTVKIPLDMADADSLAGAIKAVKGLGAHLPAGSTVDGFGNAKFGKL